MKIIFVRHGQTSENVAHRHQPENTPLSVIGRKQAVTVGEQLREHNPTHIVTSPLVRAVQTASLIADQLDMIPSIDHSLRELIRPRKLTGHGHKTIRSLLFYKLWYLGILRDGESYRTLRKRIGISQNNLAQFSPDATVIVVSHSVFINMFIAHMCRMRAIGPMEAFKTFVQVLHMKNTQCTVLEYTPIEKGCGWRKSADLQLSPDLAR